MVNSFVSELHEQYEGDELERTREAQVTQKKKKQKKTKKKQQTKQLKNIKKKKEQWLFIICQTINVGQRTFFSWLKIKNPSKWTKKN